MASQISIIQCTDDDLPSAMAAISNGFGHDAPFFDCYFPAHDTSAGQESGLKRLQFWKENSPNSTFLKATTEAGKLIGFGVWTFMTEPVSDKLDEVEADVGETWPDKDDADHMRELWQQYVPYRNGAIGDSKVLEMLAVDRDHQRQGAGLQLTEWGTRKAEEMEIEAVVEATPIGVKTYHKAGMKTVVEETDMDLSPRFADRRQVKLIFLRKGGTSG
ncbi:uncharacterized protein AB675_3717 [Cyphellophora attinorum]|uniref:N-acetyltransferase domain-containing protein n=1 Tax=Cyphellophora attinorum TaxID=1664694 RepID=A0A0N1H022_9EURO|nr:uncharacterized protein AB675_3717 [Phialophora attinorum]KPI37035.1 hypothetical protein AB675_3717 [Phialophora attinorum]